jgi:hypothetical protein
VLVVKHHYVVLFLVALLFVLALLFAVLGN